jgi:citrate synthase
MGTTIAGLEGVIAGESEICYIDGYQGVLSYRGYNIHTLADNATFEEVIYLLWNGWLPKQAELDRLRRTWSPSASCLEPLSIFSRVRPKPTPWTCFARLPPC